MGKNESKRSHPIGIIEGMFKYLILLLIPLIRTIVELLKNMPGQGLSSVTLSEWFGRVWLDLIIVAVIVAAGFVRWYMTSFKVNNSGIHIKTGVFLLQRYFLPFEKLSVLLLESPFYLEGFNAVRVRFYINSGKYIFMSKKSGVITLTLRYKDGIGILESSLKYNTAYSAVPALFPIQNINTAYKQHPKTSAAPSHRFPDVAYNNLKAQSFAKETTHTQDEKFHEKELANTQNETSKSKSPIKYTPRFGRVFILSLLNSKGLAGLLFVSSLITVGSNILGNDFKNFMYENINVGARFFAMLGAIPPIAAIVVFSLLGGWAVSFMLNVLSYKKLKISRQKDSFYIRFGLFVQKKYSFRAQKIDFITIQQTLITKMLKMVSVFLYCAGYGEKQNDLPVLFPAEKKGNIGEKLKEFIPEICNFISSANSNHEKEYLKEKQKALAINNVDGLVGTVALDRPQMQKTPCFAANSEIIKSPLRAVMGYILMPSIYILLDIAAIILFFNVNIIFSDILKFVFVMMLFPLVWYLTVSIINYKYNGMEINDDVYSLYYRKRFTFVCAIINAKDISAFTIEQNFFQRKFNMCNFTIHSYSGKPYKHRIVDVCIPPPVAGV